MSGQRGSVLVFVLTVLAMLGIVGVALSRSANARWLAAVEHRGRCVATTTIPCDHRSGAAGASTND